MKDFIEKHSKEVIIAFIVVFSLLFFKTCNDTSEIRKIKREITMLKDSVATKTECRQLKESVNDLNNNVVEFMYMETFILNNFIDLTVKNKSTNEAWNMYSKKIKELKKENEKVDK